jgi:hypothetical protein
MILSPAAALLAQDLIVNIKIPSQANFKISLRHAGDNAQSIKSVAYFGPGLMENGYFHQERLQ